MTPGYCLRVEPPPRTAPCSGAIGCTRCADCARLSALVKDGTFLLYAPGRGKVCKGFVRRIS